MVALRSTLAVALKSRPAQLTAALWLLSAAYLLFSGNGTWLGLITAMQLFQLILVLVTLRVTLPAAAPVVAEGSRGRIVVQTLVVLAVILMTVLSDTLAAGVPGWSQMVGALERLGERTLPMELVGGPGNAVANPVQYFVFPFILLLLLGARPASLGFAKGHHSWRAAAVWAAIPVGVVTVLLIAGLLPFQTLVRRFVGNSLQNGFFEEFLFRGALQSRLNALMPTAWALVAQALLFGLWHIQGNTAMLGGDPVAGLAACVVSQTLTGLWFGIIFNRTRNLLAPSIAHVCVNVMGQTFG